MLPIVFLILCVVLRVVPHPPNFAPVGATAVLAGRSLPPLLASVLIIAAMMLGDLSLAYIYGYPALSAVTPFVYGAFLLQAALGRWLRARRGGALGAALAGSGAFFVLSNFGVWATSGLYTRTADGLIACYTFALPFLVATVVGDLVWTVILSSAYRQLAQRIESRPGWVPVPSREMAAL